MSPKRPNLLFVFSDQQSFDMLGCAGNPQIKTPNIDAFAAQGLRFAHAVANCPVCTPSRSMLISGRHPLYNNCYDNDRRLLTEEEIGPGLGHVLRDAGYRMGYVGKWHLHGGDRNRPIPAGPERHGFDDCFLTNNCAINYHPSRAFYWTEAGEKVKFNEWEVAGQTAQALDFLECSKQDEPFCLFVSWHPPHNHNGGDRDSYSTFDAPEEFKALYHQDHIIPRAHLPNTPENRRMTLGYYAMCSEVDHHFGRLMAKLKEKGFEENTLVIFTSDHGENFGAHAAQCHKRNPEDVSVRVPLIMRMPGFLPVGQVSQLLFGLLNLPPTLTGLLGLEAPQNWQGTNLAPAILSGNDEAVESVPLFMFRPSWRGMYTRRFTFAMENVERTADLTQRLDSDHHPWPGRKHTPSYNVLYDREADPLQLNNLFNSTEHMDLAIDMTRQVHEWNRVFNDPFLSDKQCQAIMGERDDIPPIKLIGVATEPSSPGRLQDRS